MSIEELKEIEYNELVMLAADELDDAIINSTMEWMSEEEHNRFLDDVADFCNKEEAKILNDRFDAGLPLH